MIHVVAECAVVQPADDPAHRFLGVVLHVLHVGGDDVEAVLRDHFSEFERALAVGRDHRLQVGDVLVDVARRMFCGGEERAGLGFAQAAAAGEQEAGDQHAFVIDVAAVGGHRARRDAADVGVMAARTGVEQHFAAGVVEHRRDHRDVGQVGAAGIGVVEHPGVTRQQVAARGGDHRLHAFTHRAEVHRHVRRVGDQLAAAVKQRTGKIEALLDVDRAGGVGERRAHLLGDRHVEVVEDLQQHRVGTGPGACRRARGAACQQQFAAWRYFGLPAGFDHRRCAGIGEQGGAGDARARRQRVAEVDGRLLPSAFGIDPGPRRGRRRCRRHVRKLRGRRFVAADRLHRQRLDHQRAVRHQEAVALQVLRGEGGTHRFRASPVDGQRGVGAGVLDVGARMQRDHRGGDALVFDGLAQRGAECGDPGVAPSHCGVIEHRFQRQFTHRGDVGEAHAVGGQHAGERVDQHLRHAQCIRDAAGVLPGGAAEAGQRVRSDIMAALHRDFFDGVGHVFDGDPQKTFGHGFY